MMTLPRGKDTKLWNRFWNETKKEWFKVEVLQDYSGEDSGPSLQAWLKGEKEKSIRLMTEKINSNRWVKMAGKKPFRKIRIHIVEKPYTPYLKWEIEAYKHINIPLAKEEVYLLDKKKVSSLDIPDGDFMIFDQKRVARNYYDQSGRVYKADFYEEGENINKFILLRKKLLKLVSKNLILKIPD